MREYGKVHVAFWTSQDVVDMDEDQRTLALYLLTCPHGNMLGCFRLPSAYASDDLKWTDGRVSKAFAGLVAKRYIYRCERSSWLVIKRYLKFNQFENPNVGKSAGKLFVSLPASPDVKAILALALREFSGLFPVHILDRFEAEYEPFRNPSGLNAETGAGTGTGTGAVTVAGTGANPTVEQTQLDQARTIFAYWQKVMGSPKSVMDAKRQGFITRALKNYAPADLCKAIRGCSKSPHNMGVNDRNTKFNGIDLILRDADHIDRFIGLDAGSARAAKGVESIEDANARVMAEVLGADAGVEDANTIEMEAT